MNEYEEFIKQNKVDVVEMSSYGPRWSYYCVVNGVLIIIETKWICCELSYMIRESEIRGKILEVYEEEGRKIEGFRFYKQHWPLVRKIFKANEGNSVEKALEYIKSNIEQLQTNYINVGTLHPEGIFVGCEQPVIDRFYGNNNPKTFDRISVILKTTLSCKEDISKWLKSRENRYFMYDYALSKIGKNKLYQKYGVPTSFLRLDQIGVGKTYIRLVFLLKQ